MDFFRSKRTFRSKNSEVGILPTKIVGLNFLQKIVGNRTLGAYVTPIDALTCFVLFKSHNVAISP